MTANSLLQRDVWIVVNSIPYKGMPTMFIEKQSGLIKDVKFTNKLMQKEKKE